MSQRESAFIQAARATFDPGKRQPCNVCNGFVSLTHAHHIVPLALQVRLGREVPDQRFVWLCPTHHAAVHILIGQAASSADRASRACVALINDLSARGTDEFREVLEIAEAAWK